MTRYLRLLAALATALVLGAVSLQPALAATGAGAASPPTATPDLAQQLSTLLQQLKHQQATVNSLANQVESEQATVKTLNSKVSADKVQEQKLNKQMNGVARIEYERPALTLTTVLDARDLGQLLSGVAQARVIASQQKSLYNAAAALKAKDQKDQAAAQAELDKISKQKQQATAIAAKTQDEIVQVQAKQAQQARQAQQAQQAQQASAQPQASAPQVSAAASVTASATITLQPGPSNPNRFDPGQCTWYVAQIYSIPWMGNANEWPAGAAAAGQAEGMTPVVGAIMESADSGFGHVSVVTSVSDYNDWTVTEMNYMGPFVTDTRQVSRGSSNLVTFIY